MSLTVVQIMDKVSELRSKIAIYEGLILYLKANYKSSDAGEAEMSFTRDDHATVPEVHVDTFIKDAVDTLDQMRVELEHWESMPVPSPDDEVEVPAQTKKGKKSRGSARRHQDQPASGDGGTTEAG